jgi:hypothetical protein
MRRLLFRLTLTAGSALMLHADMLSAQNTCHTADKYSDLFIKQFQSLMGSDEDAMRLRARFNLPVVPSSQILLVSDSTVCAKIGAAADSMMTLWDPTDPAVASTIPVYVIQIGSSYAMVDLNAPPEYREERTSVWIFGPASEYRGMLAL